MRRYRTSCVFIAVCALTTDLSAQSVARLPLGPAQQLDAEFTYVNSVRELADRSVLVSDGRDNSLWQVRFPATAVPVGRKGRGPLEYAKSGFLFALGGDSTHMGDFFTRRFLIFDGARPVITVPPDHPAVVATRGVVYGADALGRLLGRGTSAPLHGGVNEVRSTDSVALVLVSRSSGRVDTVTRLRVRPQQILATTNDSGRVTAYQSLPPEAGSRAEEARLFTDGWIAVVRVEPFRVDWRRPDGGWILGAPLPVPFEVHSMADRRAFERSEAFARSESRRMGLPFQSRSMPAIGSKRHPWEGRAPAAAPDGRLLILRSSRESITATRYLVVDRRGMLNGEIHLPKGSLIVGSGRNAVYATLKDADDFDRLTRYAWP